jgi:hypothetical protein
MWGGTGAGGGGTGPAVDNAGGTVTADQSNGFKFNFAGKGDRAAADYDWSFSGGAAVAAQPNIKNGTVTFTDAGPKVITLTLGTSGGTTPAGGTYTYNVTATSAMPRSLPPGGGEEPPEEEGEFDPGDYTIDEVKAYVGENPDQIEEVLAAEEAGKNRVTLVDWLVAQGAGE